VFKKLGFQVSQPDLEGVCSCAPGIVERVLHSLHLQINKIKEAGVLPTTAPPKRPGQAKSKAPVVDVNKMGGNRGKRGVIQQERTSPKKAEDPYAPPQAVNQAPRHEPPAARIPPRSGRSRQNDPEPVPVPVQQQSPPQRQSPPSRHSRASQQAHVSPPAEVTHNAYVQRDVDTEILVEKEQTIQELRETVDILETKIRKLEQLVKLKDTKITSLQAKVQTARD